MRVLVTALQVLGLGGVFYGSYLLAPPVAYILAGLLVLGLGVALEVLRLRKGGAPRRRDQ